MQLINIMNNRSATSAIPTDFSAVLHENFQQLNALPTFDTDFLNEHDDWLLLCFLNEQRRNGNPVEVSLSALNSIVGLLAEDSSFHNPFNNSTGHMNQCYHLIGESGNDFS